MREVRLPIQPEHHRPQGRIIFNFNTVNFSGGPFLARPKRGTGVCRTPVLTATPNGRHPPAQPSNRKDWLGYRGYTMWTIPCRFDTVPSIPVSEIYRHVNREKQRGRQTHRSPSTRDRDMARKLRHDEANRMWSEAFRDHELAETVALGNYPLMEIFRGVVLAQSTKHRDPHI